MHWGEINSLLFCAGALAPLFRDRLFIKAAVCRVGRAIVPGVYKEKCRMVGPYPSLKGDLVIICTYTFLLVQKLQFYTQA